MRNVSIGVWVVFTLSSCVWAPAQPPAEPKPPDKPPTSPPTSQDQPSAKGELQKLLAKEGVSVDKEKSIVRAQGKVTVVDDFLEYVAIGPQGKKHEGLVTLECLGSTLKAALMVIGVKDGKNVDFQPIEPMPSEEEVRKGAPTTRIIEPEGTRLHLALTWTDDKQREHTVSIDDLIVDLRGNGPLQNAEWIFFGGMMAPLLRGEPPVFVADYEQNYISTYLAKPDSHLMTLKHERARYDDNWFPNTDLLPPRGTPCSLVFSLQPVVERLPAKKDKEPAPTGGTKEPGKE